MNYILLCLLSVLLFGLTGCFSLTGGGDSGLPAGCGKIDNAESGPVCGESREDSVHPDSRNWAPLFDYALSNADFERGVWYIDERGRLTAAEDQPIWTEREYGNFVLDLEYSCAPGANSGVLIYATDTENWIPATVEIQIQDDLDPHWAEVPDTWRNGGLFGHCAPKVFNVRPAGEWNRMTITAAGRNITVAVNGEITVEADLSDWKDAEKNPDGSEIPSWLSTPWAELPVRGKIGLQGRHGNATIYFRNVRIKEL
ncbi:MAG: DUF1080 domain-containing protein [Kiritimatiellia bacterium]